MKRIRPIFIAFCLVISVLFTSCSSEEKNITITDIETAIQTVDPGFTFDDKPLFQLIGAQDGWMGYATHGSQIAVKVYQYENESSYQEALKNYGETIENMPKVGAFVLDCSDEDITNAFLNAGDLSSESSSEPSEQQDNKIAVNQTYSMENLCEFSIESVKFSYDVFPQCDSILNNHYPASEGKIYLDIVANIKNLRKEAVSCDSIAEFTLDYNNGYTYNSFAVIEDEGFGFSNANIRNIDPLETITFHYLIDCPIEVYSNPYPLNLTAKFGPNTFELVLRDENGNTDALSSNEADLTDNQQQTIQNSLSALRIEPDWIENGPAITVDDFGGSAALEEIVSNMKQYYIHASNDGLYTLFYDTKFERVVMVNETSESGEVTTLLNDIESLIDLYYPPVASYTPTEPSASSSYTQPNYFEEDIKYFHDISEE